MRPLRRTTSASSARDASTSRSSAPASWTLDRIRPARVVLGIFAAAMGAIRADGSAPGLRAYQYSFPRRLRGLAPSLGFRHARVPARIVGVLDVVRGLSGGCASRGRGSKATPEATGPPCCDGGS